MGLLCAGRGRRLPETGAGGSMSDLSYITEILEELIRIPSPSGYTGPVLERIGQEAAKFGYACERSRAGSLIITVPGRGAGVLGLVAHADTLGAMVRSIRPDGTLAIFSVGGFSMQSIEGSYCRILTRGGRTYTGTVETVSPSVHTYDDARTLERTERNMEVRIDEEVRSREDVEELGIGPGDFISFDPKFVRTESGFIKSRHLDDKASVAVLLGLLSFLAGSGKQPEKTLKILISGYEEVGHGCSFLPPEVEELLAVDMGAVGADLSGDEYRVSICAGDSSGPYDFEMTNRLIRLAQEYGVDYAVDIFPHYRSDVSAARAAGHEIRGALIGPGVLASHGQERTHERALEQTFLLLAAFTGVLEPAVSRQFFRRGMRTECAGDPGAGNAG